MTRSRGTSTTSSPAPESVPEGLRSNITLQVVIVLLGGLLVAVGAIPAQANLSPLWTGIGTGLIGAGAVTVLQLALVGDPFKALFSQLQDATSKLQSSIVDRVGCVARRVVQRRAAGMDGPFCGAARVGGCVDRGVAARDRHRHRRLRRRVSPPRRTGPAA